MSKRFANLFCRAISAIGDGAHERREGAADANDGSTKRIDVQMIIALNELSNGARSRKRKR